MSDKFTIDYETAEDEFNRFCEAWEIENDSENLKDAEEKDNFNALKNQIITAIQRGRLCLNENDDLEYTISDKTKNENKRGKKLTIKMPVGATYMELLKKNKDKMIYAALGHMTGHAIEWFSDISGIDLKPLHAVVNLFLA
jgi:predicted ATPase